MTMIKSNEYFVNEGKTYFNCHLILMFQAMVTGNVAANFLDNPFFQQFMAKARPSYKLPAQNEKLSKELVSAEFERHSH